MIPIKVLRNALSALVPLAMLGTTVLTGGTAAHADSAQAPIQQYGGNGYCLGTQNGRTQNGTAAIIWPCNNNPDQQWIVEDRGDGTYRIRNLGSHTCLGNIGNTNQQENTLIIWSCNNNKDQVWTVQGVYGSTSSSVTNGWNLSMSTYRQGTYEGTFATQRTYTGSSDQYWFIRVPFF